MKLAAFFVAALAGGFADAGELPFAMHAGDSWTYDAKVEWLASGNVAKSATVPWTMKVVDVVKGPHARAVIVQDFLGHLAWYDPAAPKTPRFDVIVVRPEGVWIDDDVASRDDARSRAKHAAAGDAIGHQLLAFPLRDKACVDAEDPERNDGSYCWVLRRDDSKPDGRSWNLTYQSLPDEETFGFTEGVGFTAYTYMHHGTLASADAVLRK